MISAAFTNAFNPSLVTASAILLVGVIDDLRTRKFHNWLFITCTVVAFAVSFYAGSWPGLNSAVLGFVAGFLIVLPLVRMKMLGAGDMKLLAAFGAMVGWSVVIDVAILSLIWGAIFGLIQVITKGQLKATLQNMATIASMKKERTDLQLHKIPFTIAFAVGWLSHLVLHRGVA